MSANERQVGGSHYQQKDGGEQLWDRIWRLYGRGYFVGCIERYVERYHLKNGIQDLEKAKHYIEKLIELETADVIRRVVEYACDDPIPRSPTPTIVMDDPEADQADVSGTPLPIIHTDFSFGGRPVIACGQGAPEPESAPDTDDLPGNHV